MKKLILGTLFSCFFFLTERNVIAQEKAFSVSLSNNVTSFPVTGYPALFYSQLHPGVDGSYEHKLNQSEKHQIWASGHAGLFYHRFIQTGFRLYPSIDYRFAPTQRFSLRVGLGAGYLHSFEGYEVFEPKENGGYETKKVWKGRSQFLVVINLGGAYSLFKDKPQSPSLFLEFRTHMQGPFVKSYVPLLPVNAINLGLSIPLKNE